MSLSVGPCWSAGPALKSSGRAHGEPAVNLDVLGSLLWQWMVQLEIGSSKAWSGMGSGARVGDRCNGRIAAESGVTVEHIVLLEVHPGHTAAAAAARSSG